MKEILPTPRQIIEELDKSVHGQKDAKSGLAKAAYNHYLSLAIKEPGRIEAQYSKQHILLLGPSGSGKTHLTKMLGDYLGVPMIFVNAAGLTVEGYVGDGINDVLARLEHSVASESSRKRAIIFLDEFDKLSTRFNSSEIRGTGVQRELLAVLDGQEIKRQHSSNKNGFDIDTSTILFILTGAFEGLEEVVRKRLGKNKIGFKGQKPNGSSDLDSESWVRSVIPDDLIEYGYLPELIGRIGNIAVLDPLSVNDLRQILITMPRSPIRQQRDMYRLHGITLEYTDDALTYLAEEASKFPTGARALSHVVMACTKEIDILLPDLRSQGINRIVVDQEAARTGKPRLLHDNDSSLEDISQKLRESALVGMPNPKASSQPQNDLLPPHITNTKGWSNEKIIERLEVVKTSISYQDAKGSAKKWWDEFENENSPAKIALVLRLAEELLIRKATVTEFFLAYVYSGTDNIQGNLVYLDFARAKRKKQPDERTTIQSNENLNFDTVRSYVHYEKGDPLDKALWSQLEKSIVTQKNLDQLTMLVQSEKLVISKISSLMACSGEVTISLLGSWITFASLHEKNKKPVEEQVLLKFGTVDSLLNEFYLRLKLNLVRHLVKREETILDDEQKKFLADALAKSQYQVPGSWEDFAEVVKSLTYNDAIIWSSYTMSALLDLYREKFKLVFISEAGPTKKWFEQTVSTSQHRFGERDIFLSMIGYLPRPSTLTAEGVGRLLEYIGEAKIQFDSIGEHLIREWGPGPWAEG